MPTLDYQLPSFPITPAQFAQRCTQSSQFSKYMWVVRWVFPVIFMIAIERASLISALLPSLPAGLRGVMFGVGIGLLASAADAITNLFLSHKGLRCPICEQVIFDRRSLLLSSGHCPCCAFHILEVPNPKTAVSLPLTARYSDIIRLGVLLASVLAAGVLAAYLYHRSSITTVTLMLTSLILLILVAANIQVFRTRVLADSTGLHIRSAWGPTRFRPWNSIRTPLIYSTSLRAFQIPPPRPSSHPINSPPHSSSSLIPLRLDGINDLLYLIHHPPKSPPD